MGTREGQCPSRTARRANTTSLGAQSFHELASRPQESVRDRASKAEGRLKLSSGTSSTRRRLWSDGGSLCGTRFQANV